MDLYGQTSKSIPQKVVIHLLELGLIWLSIWILFRDGGDWCEKHLYIQNASENTARRMIIFAFNIITFLRIAYAMLFLLKRRIPWEESISVPIAFALYFVGFSLFVLPATEPPGASDYFAIALFGVGCILNSGSELLRNSWKKKPENTGRIYTGGLFRYSRHINYFGDVLWVLAYALITRSWFALVIPVLLFIFFAFYNAPKLDRYLQHKYGAQYDAYAKRTKMLVPFIF
jgi:protein-S-isoprenylcysteine O-methyltransferase Ste14